MNLVWFRNDLRVDDNPALSLSMSDNRSPVTGIYLYYPEQLQHYGIGSNYHHLILTELKNLHSRLHQLNIPLVIINCGLFSLSAEILEMICQELKATSLFFNVEYPIDERKRDKAVVDKLSSHVKCHRLIADSLVPPWLTVNGQKLGYKVFSAFEKTHQKILFDCPLTLACDIKKQPISNLKKITDWHCSNPVLSKKILSTIPAIKPTAIQMPEISEKNIQKHLTQYCSNKILDYSKNRDYPSIDGTSNISAALAVGTISIKQCYSIAKSQQGLQAYSWIRQLVWRDFYRSVMWHFPHTCKGEAFNSVDRQINWSKDSEAIRRFQSGKTGIPIVDAAIIQLIKTGWMHNRLRMIVASYLTKNLWVDWRVGEAFFAEHLFDYDFANNNGGWQWSSSVGTDAVPYFRVFNPQSQQKKFDVNTDFIKQWLPTLKKLDAKSIHNFDKHKFEDYPAPQVNIKETRQQAIEAFKNAKIFST